MALAFPTLRKSQVLLVHETHERTVAARSATALKQALEANGVGVTMSEYGDDAIAVMTSDAAVDCVIVDWDLIDEGGRRPAPDIVRTVRERSTTLPVFLAASRSQLTNIPSDVLRNVDDYIWMLEDTTDFIAGRIVSSIQRYRELLFPPMFRALIEFVENYQYSWHTPGHTGGTAFLRTAAGRAFFDFYGEHLFRTDLSISVGALGSLLDHNGPIGEAERFAAEVFGADRTYFVTNGSSTANRMVFSAFVSAGDAVLVDRNCHKSIEHACIMTGGIPVYLIPSRNRYGIIGPIYPELLTPEAVQAAIAANPLLEHPTDPVHAIITNSTYDGLTYDVEGVTGVLGRSVDRIHFDEAWFGYARFNPIYAGRHAMHTGPIDRDGPTLLATQSTHKLLPALSQASMLHIRQGRVPVHHHRFNEAFMMHSSTSPAYVIIASNDVAAKMMEGPTGRRLTDECIEEAVSFRKTVARIRREEQAKGGWFFGVWQPEEVTDPDTGLRVPFDEAPDDLLRTDPQCWVLHPGDTWHGFDNLADGHCMLDPIKVTVTTPGMGDDGNLALTGISAHLVSRFLEGRGIVVEKTGDFTMLFLFSMGITKGKWGTLVSALFEFRRLYDLNARLVDVLPDLVAIDPTKYADLGMRDLADEMHVQLARGNDAALLAEAFGTLPAPVMSPVRAYRHLVRGEVDHVPLSALANRTVAVGVVPYPPGIPVLMPGENAGPEDGPVMRYLRLLREFDAALPGFESDNHGVEVIDGEYYVYCVRQSPPGV